MNSFSLGALGRWALVALTALGTVPAAHEGTRVGREKDREREEARYDKAAEAQRFYAKRRAPIGETAVPAERYAQALKQMRSMQVFSSAEQSFRSGVGRWNSVAVTPELPNI